eukprot:gnl/Dysnectes_brevis/142_a167_7806.p1 GENE.gnl/Dysnectes_brevis/142_a167_7806~~gnl/Dysnectes_brevis/142_a167_7806.p1  ORF type:complete len:515 (-),score=193.38 gnl/Dysnectes_brevis/142_a167_7806:35-1579(-)
MSAEQLNKKIADLARAYRPLAVEWLAEAIRLPEDDIAENPMSGQSNGEGPRLHYLRDEIIKHKCVLNPEDVGFDGIGNLVWVVEDPKDTTPKADKVVVMFDGHSDTVAPLPEQWPKVIGGVDAFKGLVDPKQIKREALFENLGWVPAEDQYENCVWGRGCADQIGGVVCQMMATKIMLELRDEFDTLTGIIIRSVATVQEEDNDGAGPMYIIRKELPGKGPELVPDVIIFTEGTGDSTRSGLGIYRGQRGRMQIEVEVQGASCHGSMPHMGKNPLEFGARILVEATAQVEAGEGILHHDFLGKGTRTASWCHLDTPSNCACPDKFVFRFDRRITVGETPDQCVADVEGLPAVAVARAAGLTVTVGVPTYQKLSWKGYAPGNKEIYMGWETPEDHPAITAAVQSYDGTIAKHITEEESHQMRGYIKQEAHVGRWIFSTDGVGVPVPEDWEECEIPATKGWIHQGGFKYPAMLGLGPGSEQNTHRIGEVIHKVELQHASAWMARYPSQFRDAKLKK